MRIEKGSAYTWETFIDTKRSSKWVKKRIKWRYENWKGAKDGKLRKSDDRHYRHSCYGREGGGVHASLKRSSDAGNSRGFAVGG